MGRATVAVAPHISPWKTLSSHGFPMVSQGTPTEDPQFQSAPLPCRSDTVALQNAEMLVLRMVLKVLV